MTGLQFTEDQRLLRDNVRGYLDKTASLDQVARWDEAQSYPAEFFQGLVDQGYLALPLPGAYGGSDAGPVELAIVGEELGRRGLDLASGFGLTAFLALNIARFGTEEQKNRHLPAVLSGRERYAISTTEPDAGSDAAAIRTAARPDGDGWLITGQKVYSSGAAHPGTVLHVTTRTDPDGPKHAGMSVFMVPNDAPGVQIRKLRTVGRHILGTYEVFYDDVRVGPEQLLGRVGDGWSVLGAGLELERLWAAASYTGAAQVVLEMTIDFVNQRSQFGRPIGAFQGVSHPIADVHCQVEAARLLSYQAAEVIARGEPAAREVAVAKLFSSEALQRATQTGMQLMGGAGYMKEYHMERYWREAMSTTVVAGTSQIQRTVIARALGVVTR
jgi:alkylation response protein AidB-like acyl-CoA dehydrogenase